MPLHVQAQARNEHPNQNIGSDRLLGIPEVCALTGLCPVTTSKLMKESGHSFKLHGRVFVFETSLFSYLKTLESGEAEDE